MSQALPPKKRKENRRSEEEQEQLPPPSSTEESSEPASSPPASDASPPRGSTETPPLLVDDARRQLKQLTLRVKSEPGMKWEEDDITERDGDADDDIGRTHLTPAIGNISLKDPSELQHAPNVTIQHALPMQLLLYAQTQIEQARAGRPPPARPLAFHPSLPFPALPLPLPFPNLAWGARLPPHLPFNINCLVPGIGGPLSAAPLPSRSINGFNPGPPRRPPSPPDLPISIPDGLGGSTRKLSRDEVQAAKIGLTAHEMDRVVHMPMEEFTEFCQSRCLPEEQVSTLRDLRRRGKNKVAAQNCRKRKIDQIEDLEVKVDKAKAKAEEIKQENDELMKELARVEEEWASIQKAQLSPQGGIPFPPDLADLAAQGLRPRHKCMECGEPDSTCWSDSTHELIILESRISG